ncbi:hypothetical protein GCM10010174_09030 [Kutzneria viridogrisea]|uniref:Uncharacterized protein n=2 Tax=Kutzneria TaxID=43356 RepID=W5WTK6_9PSEU|nr:hypothetical protein [Kutzneria albida]AHI01495.1 hypothetical protein KALB_8137 [Kutzneria albida DSM 43870]MBA8931458.1 hypothetical protein [Kutzneria viridogrisea]
MLTLTIVSSIVFIGALVWRPRRGAHAGGGPEGTHTVSHLIDTIELELEPTGRHTKRRSVAQRESSYRFDS